MLHSGCRVLAKWIKRHALVKKCDMSLVSFLLTISFSGVTIWMCLQAVVSTSACNSRIHWWLVGLWRNAKKKMQQQTKTSTVDGDMLVWPSYFLQLLSFSRHAAERAHSAPAFHLLFVKNATCILWQCITWLVMWVVCALFSADLHSILPSEGKWNNSYE